MMRDALEGGSTPQSKKPLGSGEILRELDDPLDLYE
jgi:hypothetical protein